MMPLMPRVLRQQQFGYFGGSSHSHVLDNLQRDSMFKYLLNISHLPNAFERSFNHSVHIWLHSRIASRRMLLLCPSNWRMKPASQGRNMVNRLNLKAWPIYLGCGVWHSRSFGSTAPPTRCDVCLRVCTNVLKALESLEILGKVAKHCDQSTPIPSAWINSVWWWCIWEWTFSASRAFGFGQKAMQAQPK